MMRSNDELQNNSYNQDPPDLCARLAGLVTEHALGEFGELSIVERRQVEEHLNLCSSCQEKAKLVGAIASSFKAVNELEIPEKILLNTRYKTLAMLRKNEEERCLPEAEKIILRRKVSWLELSAAAAVIAVIICGGYRLWNELSPAEENNSNIAKLQPQMALANNNRPEKVVANVVKVEDVDEVEDVVINRGLVRSETEISKMTLQERFELLKSSSNALAMLQDEFKKIKKNPHALEEDFAELIALSEQLLARWPDCDERFETKKFLSRCYAEIGEHQLSREIFLAYASEVGEKSREDAIKSGVSESEAQMAADRESCETFRKEADHLFEEEDYLAAIDYYNAIRREFPGTGAARHAQQMTGEYYLKMREPDGAIEEFKAVIEAAPNSYAARQARVALPSALFNSGLKEEAVKAWIDYSATSIGTNPKACGYYNAGVVLVACGKDYYPDSIEMFNTVINRYPNSTYAKAAKSMLKKITKKYLKKIDDDFLDEG